jgi:hypothetical protein
VTLVAVQPAVCADGNSLHMLLLSFIQYGFKCYHKPTFLSPLPCDQAVTYHTAAVSGIHKTMKCTFSEKYRMTAIHIALIKFKKYDEYSCSGDILRQGHKSKGTVVFVMSRHDLLLFLMRIFDICMCLGM